MRYLSALFTVTLALTSCGSINGFLQPPTDTSGSPGTPAAPTPPSDAPGLADVSRQTLQPGQKVDVPLTVTAPPNGAAYTVTAESPAPELITATVTGSTLTLEVSAAAAAQGLIPVKVTVTTPTKSVTVRVPVEIGNLISKEFARFNALRAQAALDPVTFDDTASMNCWLHGRYSVVNKVLEHTENLSLPFATPEGRDCAGKSNRSPSIYHGDVDPTAPCR